IPAFAGIWRLDISWSGEAQPGSAGVPPAIVAAGHRSGLRPLRGGRDARRDAWRDARAPRMAASNARFVSNQCVPPAKRLFGYGFTQTALTTTEMPCEGPEKMSSLQIPAKAGI
ncbi:MAG: hypothetical protein L0387_24530, partial [Acidobacteria bacterium]|nr:hypothetical protein [Acidobacteriota bacterium]